MARRFVMPKGPLVTQSGAPNTSGQNYLIAIEEFSRPLASASAIPNLDGLTTYSNDELRDKLIALIAALKE